MNKREAAVISAFTGILIGDFSEMHQYIEQVLGRAVWTHELAGKEFNEKLKEAAKPDFLAIHESITDQ